MTLLQNTPRGEARAAAEGMLPAELHCRAHKRAQRRVFAIAAPRISPENCSALPMSFPFFVSPEHSSPPHCWALPSQLGGWPCPRRPQDGVGGSSAPKAGGKATLTFPL